jgi:23S rRNA (guanosine2251-2'-O)-methyltransferase
LLGIDEAMTHNSHQVIVLLDNIRSLYNTGSILRTADASGVERVVLCGITPRPDQGSRQRRAIAKTALGAEDTVPWEYQPEAVATLRSLTAAGYHTVAVETTADAVNLFEWTPRWPVCLVFGHETDGVSSDLAAHVDAVIRIPMLGKKRSLNVATAAGVVLYELLRHRLYATDGGASTTT